MRPTIQIDSSKEIFLKHSQSLLLDEAKHSPLDYISQGYRTVEPLKIKMPAKSSSGASNLFFKAKNTLKQKRDTISSSGEILSV